MSKTETIQRYLDLGWIIFPTRSKGARSPGLDDWQKATKPISDLRKYRYGAYLQCGSRSGISVIDLDSRKWFAELGALVAEYPTPYAQTPSGGAHILVSYSSADWWGNQVRLAEDLDLRNDQGGIVLPWIEEGRAWAPGHAPWEIEPHDPAPYEEWLQSISNRDTSPSRPSGSSSTLAGLLARPPIEGQRSDWLVRVAGHLVPLIPWEDGYQALMQIINQAMPDPLDSAEIDATINKLYSRDRAKSGDPHADHPWESGDGNLWLWSGMGQQRERHLWLEPEPILVKHFRGVEGDVSWEVANGDRTARLYPIDVHAQQRLAATLGGIDVLVYPKATGSTPNGNQLQKWLNSKEAPVTITAPWWGWNDELDEWVGLEGDAIGPAGYQPLIGEIDRPDIISQMPTWQDDQTAAVFCAWLALQAAKGNVAMTIEPNLVLQGRAGSGKTRGLFSFGARLTGSERVASGTIATLRDRIASHRNGIVVIDDHSNLESSSTKLLELYRVSTTSEALTLKKQDQGGWSDQKVQLVGSILASGESLMDLANDRALRDRSIILEVQPAGSRMSLKNPGETQWSDIQAVFEELGGFDEAVAHQLAGPFIRRIVAAIDEVEPSKLIDGERVSAKLELLRYGAKLWQAAYPESRTYDTQTVNEAVDAWCLDQRKVSGWEDTSLIRKILPAMVDPSVGAINSVKILEDEGTVHFHLQRLSRAWVDRRDQRDQEIGGVDNMRREIELLQEAGRIRYHRVLRMGSRNTKVYSLDEIASQVVLQAAGVELGEEA